MTPTALAYSICHHVRLSTQRGPPITLNVPPGSSSPDTALGSVSDGGLRMLIELVVMERACMPTASRVGRPPAHTTDPVATGTVGVGGATAKGVGLGMGVTIAVWTGVLPGVPPGAPEVSVHRKTVWRLADTR